MHRFLVFCWITTALALPQGYNYHQSAGASVHSESSIPTLIAPKFLQEALQQQQQQKQQQQQLGVIATTTYPPSHASSTQQHYQAAASSVDLRQQLPQQQQQQLLPLQQQLPLLQQLPSQQQQQPQQHTSLQQLTAAQHFLPLQQPFLQQQQQQQQQHQQHLPHLPQLIPTQQQQQQQQQQFSHSPSQTQIINRAHQSGPIITKDIYVHIPPLDDAEQHQSQEQQQHNLAAPRKHYRIVFIKTPTPTTHPSAIRLSHAPIEEKTIIYVLSKKQDPALLEATLQESLAKQKPNKPEVYFIKYKTAEEAQHVQRTIQAQYDQLGGTTQISDEGVAPVTSVIGSLNNNNNNNNNNIHYNNLPTTRSN